MLTEEAIPGQRRWEGLPLSLIKEKKDYWEGNGSWPSSLTEEIHALLCSEDKGNNGASKRMAVLETGALVITTFHVSYKAQKLQSNTKDPVGLNKGLEQKAVTPQKTRGVLPAFWLCKRHCSV